MKIMLKSKRWLKTIYTPLLTIIMMTIISCDNMITDALDDTSYEYYLYTSNQNSQNISMFKIAEDGRLVLSDILEIPGTPYSIRTNPQGKYVYVLSLTDTVFGFNVAADGSLLYMTGKVTGSQPHSFVINSYGTRIFTINYYASTISQFQVSSDGLITSAGTAQSARTQSNFSTLHTAGTALYVTTESGYISHFPIGSDDNLTGARTDYAISSPREPVVHPGGNYLYMPQRDGVALKQISVIQLNSDGSPGSSGTLTVVSTTITGGFPGFCTFDKKGEFFYVPTTSADKVEVYMWNSSNGSLSLIDSVNAGTGPFDVIIHPNGRFLYCQNITSNTISAFSIGSDGRLTSLASEVSTGGSQALRMCIVQRLKHD